MTTIDGQFYEAHVSTRHSAQLEFNGQSYVLYCDSLPPRTGHIKALTVSDRLANIPRRLQWPDGSAFETTDNDAIDSAFATTHSTGGLIHRLERSWRFVPFAIALIGCIAFATFKWGLPAASKHIAMQLPVSAHELVSKGAISTLDKVLFEPSELSSSQKDEVTQRFEHLISKLNPAEFNYRLYFRKMSMGDLELPNAMALPSGEIIVTDEFVRIAEAGELEAVLLHEIGHVEQRHGMQQVLNASATTVAVSITLGEMSGLNDLMTGVPVFLLHSSYSRNNESAADDFAFTKMAELGIDPKHFASIITKIGGVDDDTQDSTSYLSSHPGFTERAERAMQASAQFNTSQ